MDNDFDTGFCKHFRTATGVGVTVINGIGETLYATDGACGMTCGLCSHAFGSDPAETQKCSYTRLYGAFSSLRFAGRYVFFCRMGLTLFASPIVNGNILEYAVIGGPVLMIDRDEYINQEFLTFFPEYTEDDLAALNEVPEMAPERVHAVSELLHYGTRALGEARDTMHSAMSHSAQLETQQLQGVISDYIMRIKNSEQAGFYPVKKEDELLDAMSVGNIKAAKALLNELLGHIFFYSGFKFEIIRSRVLELIVLLSRAAVKAGADAELIFGLNYEYIHEIDRFENIEDLSYWLSAIMNRFTDYVFNFAGIKHTDVIYKATEYIKTHYMQKISLDDVARYVYLSPPYFSKIFKEETGGNFNTYLNNVRIEQSKKYLLNNNIALADIANMVGYEDQSYFSKVFKKVTGLSPLRFRQSRGKKSQGG